RDPLVIVAARTSRPELPVQAGHPTLAPAASPMADGHHAHPTTLRDEPIGNPVRRHHYDPRPPHQRVRQAARAHDRIQLFTLRRTNFHHQIRSAHGAALYQIGAENKISYLRDTTLGSGPCMAMLRKILAPPTAKGRSRT